MLMPHRIALLILFASATAMAQGDAEVKRYKLIRDMKFFGLGFGFGRTFEGNAEGVIPFDKPWDQLTLAQQNLVKSRYEGMSDGDEPPFPLQGLRALYGPITQGQQRLLVTGDFEAQVEIDKEGIVSKVAVLRSPSPQVTKVIANILLLTKFKPALCEGQPCAMPFPVNLSFKVED